MKYKIEHFKIDLGTTPIENIFINNFFSIADGDAIKVYIYAYKLAYESNNSHIMSEEDMAKELGMTTQDVKRAFDFWKEQGLINTFNDNDEEIYSFLSIRELFLGFTDMGSSAKEIQSEKEVSKNSNEPMSNTQMFIKIEEFLDTSLSPNEIERILSHISEFGQDRELIVRGFPYCSDVAGKRNVNYVLSVLRNWAIDGVKTIPDLERYLEKKQKTEVKKSGRKKKKRISKDDRLSSDEIQNIINKKLQMDVERARGEIDDE